MVIKPEHNVALMMSNIRNREEEVARITAKIIAALKPLKNNRLAAIDHINRLNRDRERLPTHGPFSQHTGGAWGRLDAEIALAKAELARCDENIEKARTVGYVPEMIAVKASKEKEIIALRYARESIRAHGLPKQGSIKKAKLKTRRWPDSKPHPNSADTSTPPSISSGSPPVARFAQSGTHDWQDHWVTLKKD